MALRHAPPADTPSTCRSARFAHACLAAETSCARSQSRRSRGFWDEISTTSKTRSYTQSAAKGREFFAYTPGCTAENRLPAGGKRIRTFGPAYQPARELSGGPSPISMRGHGVARQAAGRAARLKPDDPTILDDG
jgi:hypothetical protein